MQFQAQQTRDQTNKLRLLAYFRSGHSAKFLSAQLSQHLISDLNRTDLHRICRDGRTMAVDERSEVPFSIPRGTFSVNNKPTIFRNFIMMHLFNYTVHC